MNAKERIFLITLLLLVIGGLALIPDNPVSRQRMRTPSPVDWAVVQDDPARQHTLNWQGIIAYAGGEEGSWMERFLESRFNLDLNPVFFDSIGWERRRPLMLTGGDVPDVMWDGDPLGMRKNLRNGFIMEVPYEVILKHAPTYVHYLNKSGREAWLYSHVEGRNFGLPTFFGDADHPRIGAWRLDWLRKVGIEKTPETIKEMEDALRRMRFDDPDGNGKQDTYGWCPSLSHWSIFFSEIFAACDVLPFDFICKDGKVVWGGVQPESRRALEVIRTWYEQDLLDPDFQLDIRGDTGERKFISGKTGYMYPLDDPAAYDVSLENSAIYNLRQFRPEAEIIPAAPLRNDRGQRRGRSWGGAGHILQFGRHLEQQPEKVLRILDMMENIAADPDLYFKAQFGNRGEHWTYTEEDGYLLLSPYAGNNRLQGAELLPNNIFYFPSVIEEYDTQTLTPEVLDWYQTYKKAEWGVKNVLGKSDVLPSSGRYLGDLRNYQLIAYMEFIAGKRPMSEFDEFVTEWYRRGGDTLTEEANSMYVTMQELWKRVGADD